MTARAGDTILPTEQGLTSSDTIPTFYQYGVLNGKSFLADAVTGVIYYCLYKNNKKI